MIQTTSLTKQFNGNTVVNNVSLSVNTGKFFGLLGPNAAGKHCARLQQYLIIPTISHEINRNGVRDTYRAT